MGGGGARSQAGAPRAFRLPRRLCCFLPQKKKGKEAGPGAALPPPRTPVLPAEARAPHAGSPASAKRSKAKAKGKEVKKEVRLAAVAGAQPRPPGAPGVAAWLRGCVAVFIPHTDGVCWGCLPGHWLAGARPFLLGSEARGGRGCLSFPAEGPEALMLSLTAEPCTGRPH